MLSAIEKGKIEVAKIEDTLVSSVFDFLLLLPSNMIWQILKNSCPEVTQLEDAGKLINYDFWPKWGSKGTDNTNYVEPDVFIEFENVHIIIEAKRTDTSEQKCHQWDNELKTYENEYPNQKKVIFIALGGQSVENQTSNKKYQIVKCSWQNLLEKVISARKEIKSDADDSSKRILKSVQQALELHGILKIKWLESLLCEKSIELSSNDSQTVLNNWRNNYGK